MSIVSVNFNKIQRKTTSELKGYWALDKWTVEAFPIPDRRGNLKTI